MNDAPRDADIRARAEALGLGIARLSYRHRIAHLVSRDGAETLCGISRRLPVEPGPDTAICLICKAAMKNYKETDYE